jgi:glucose-6-phosphate isomerase
MEPGTIGYIPPGWAHRSVNTGSEAYSFLAVYPGGAGHDYGWVLQHGMGQRVFEGGDGPRFDTYSAGTTATPGRTASGDTASGD